ncbi:MAG: glycosyltransferase family 9 protein [Flavobacteriales bacterium]|nr:glycosyltransferase family 9 protein [Flavobacteriales bacterium]
MKILLIRFSSIGDIILTSPVARCIKQQLPGAEVHFLTKAIFRDLVSHSPYIDKLHTIDDELSEVIPALKRENLDLIVDLHHNLRTARVKRALGVPSKSFPKLNWEKWLMVNFKRDRLPHQHIVDRYLSTVEHLGVKNDGQGLDLFIPPQNEVALESLPEAHRSGYIALCIGGGHATKRLPPHKLVELAEELQGPLVIVGGKDDAGVAARIATAVGGRAFDATGKFDLLGSASLVKQARSVITHDSGAMHVAAAFKKRVLSIWGNTIPAFGMGPYIPQHPERAQLVEVEGLDCRPCSKLGYETCPKGHFRCMEKQDTARIAQLANA